MCDGVEVEQRRDSHIILLSHWVLEHIEGNRVDFKLKIRNNWFLTSATNVISPNLSVPGNHPGPFTNAKKKSVQLLIDLAFSMSFP